MNYSDSAMLHVVRALVARRAKITLQLHGSNDPFDYLKLDFVGDVESEDLGFLFSAST